MSGRKFSGKELAKALQAGEFEQSGLVLTGMVKPSEQPDHVGFARRLRHLGRPPHHDDRARRARRLPPVRGPLASGLQDHAEGIGGSPGEAARPTALGSAADRPARAACRGWTGGSARRKRSDAPGAARPLLYLCDALVRECISLGGNYEACLGLRATCSDICGIISVFDPVFF